ncbi:unnamed protein product [Arabidopsis thaliana]|uniref:Uncharacterized protein n=2 Tax=Arabidopsis thaliana TaxID=3702 RepID=A0A654EX53_ARATH|nr:uncharacterized protein AT2G05753 [Arabidopsis thaliana]AEC05968.1 hypothetical protein AT2G05753 [Arabidopsis thaliana]VYS52122.1 unnamed protein product [Arabidopsis thaliana]|eukprot:NP_001154498.1 hypothetical protein AT2G05753 [Arabidopsis thaliana]
MKDNPRGLLKPKASLHEQVQISVAQFFSTKAQGNTKVSTCTHLRRDSITTRKDKFLDKSTDEITGYTIGELKKY